MTKQPVWSWTDAVAGAKVPPLTKLVCLNIARYLSSAGKGWNIKSTDMQRETGLSNKTLAVHLQNAEKAGLIVIKRQYDHHGHRSITQYVPQFPDGTELAKTPAEMPPLSVPPTPRSPASLSVGDTSGLGVGGTPQVSSLVSLSKKEKSPKPTVFEDGAGSRLIPFSSTDAPSVIQAARNEAAKKSLGLAVDRLPFTKEVTLEIARMCVDLDRLTRKYLEKTAGKRIKNPSGYLLKMARDEVAQRDGVSVELVARLATSDRQQKAQLMAEAVGVKPEPRRWKAARWREKMKVAS